MPGYVVSVGMEVHAELLTRSKMFCRCLVTFGGEPNTRVCPVCLGLPGSLPVPNRKAIELVLKTALALNCKIAMESVFHRKNYFYPDLPKGYQVSQYGETNPLGYKGWLDIPRRGGGTKRIAIRRVHLEEDTGKLMHLPNGGSGVDYNRAGVPLMEVVTDFPPDIECPEEAKEYLVQLRNILLYLGVCDGKMEEGSLRCEPNISIRPEGGVDYGTKTELKNLSSFRSVQLGIQFEARRQAALIEQGQRVAQETRGWNEGAESSFAMRTKEAENDYRYFPDPDLAPMCFEETDIEILRASLPELPLAKSIRYQQQFGLSDYDSNLLVAERSWAGYFERCVGLGGDPKLVCNWMNSDFARLLKESGQTVDAGREDRVQSLVVPERLVELIGLVADGRITGKVAKEVFARVFETGESPGRIVAREGLTSIKDDGAVQTWVRDVLAENPDAVEKFRKGQTTVLGFFVGQVMKKSQGRADPELVHAAVEAALGEG